MKLKTLIGMVIFCFSGVVFSAGSYFPPERIQCKLNHIGHLACENFDRQYLSEATYAVDLPVGKDFVFLFSSGTAYHNENSWTIFYTYKEAMSGKRIHIKTINTSLSPDLVRGTWRMSKDIYTCKSGYMSCSMNPV